VQPLLLLFRKKIKKNLTDEIKEYNKKSFSLNNIFSVFLKPQVSLTFIILIITIYLIVPNRSNNYKELIKSQVGNSNMFVQAEQNFSKILNGKLKVQFASNNSDILKKFFFDKGVSYQTTIPVFNDLELLGVSYPK